MSALRLCARLLLGVLFVPPAFAATADSDGLHQCAAIDAAQARLACYDKLAGRMPPPSGQEAAAPGRPAPVAPAAGVAAGDEGAAQFGLSPAQRKVVPSGPSAIQARIAGLSADRLGNAVVALDNGQTWHVSDNDARLEVGQEVTIKRGALGSFLMTTPDRHSYHARRTR